MNKDELYAWMNSNKIVYEEGEWDDRNNHLTFQIYESNGEYFRVNFCNGFPSKKWVNGKGYIRGVYEPTKVTRKTEMVEKVYWT